MAGLQRTRGCASHQTEAWRNAPAREGPRNASNNKAHEPTSGRSTHYGSAHLIQVFRDIGHIFSSLRPFIGGSVFLVALAPRAGLVIPRQTFVRRSHNGRTAAGARLIAGVEQKRTPLSCAPGLCRSVRMRRPDCALVKPLGALLRLACDRSGDEVN